MQLALRPYATAAGVAIVGASLLAATPGMTAAPHALRDVALTSTLGDFMAPWTEQYNTAVENASVLANNFSAAPFVGLQQNLANLNELWQEVLTDPSKMSDVTAQLQEQLVAISSGFSLFDATQQVIDSVTLHTVSATDPVTLAFGHDLILQLLPNFLPADIDKDLAISVVNFLSSPMSAMIMGAVGPGLSPLVALSNSITDGDGFNEILANMSGAFFNGATLNLDSIIPMIAETGLLPAGTDIHHLEFAFGGLFTPGVVGQHSYQLFDSSGNVVSDIAAPGGSIFNSLGLSLETSVLPGFPIDIAGQGIGPIGAWLAWEQTVAGLLDGGKGHSPWAWDGKSGGTPPPAIPPLNNLNIPTVPGDHYDQLGDDGGAANAAAELGGGVDLSGFADAFGLSA